jgi:hypothetical protein
VNKTLTTESPEVNREKIKSVAFLFVSAFSVVVFTLIKAILDKSDLAQKSKKKVHSIKAVEFQATIWLPVFDCIQDRLFLS